MWVRQFEARDGHGRLPPLTYKVDDVLGHRMLEFHLKWTTRSRCESMFKRHPLQ